MIILRKTFSSKSEKKTDKKKDNTVKRVLQLVVDYM